ncbi:DUF4097 family beta strand repeat-containing protein [Fibrella aestuarina]|nr:DUF4097 family beta strand repeat-containing protein [Fibrella aestuarina]
MSLLRTFLLLTTTLTAAILLSVACSPAISGILTDDRDSKPYKTQTFTGINAVRAQTSGGSLTVEGGNGAEARLEMYVRSSNWNGRDELSREEIEDRLRDYEINIRQDGGTLVATAKSKRDGSWWNNRNALSISFKFFTPRRVNTDLNTSGGSIQISHLDGKQRFETSGGSLRLVDLKGDIAGRTSGGSIKLDGCRERVDVETSGGSIEASNSNGNLTLETSGGSLRLMGLNGMIKARTSGGSINGDQIDGELQTSTSGGSIRIRNMAGSIDANTSGGSVEVNLTRVDKFVTLGTSAGSVRVQMPMNKGMDLELDGNRVSAPLSNFSGTADKDRIVGKINGGGIPVKLTASAGNVYLNQN